MRLCDRFWVLNVRLMFVVLGVVFIEVRVCDSEVCGNWLADERRVLEYIGLSDAVNWDPDGEGPLEEMLVVSGTMSDGSGGLDRIAVARWTGDRFTPLLRVRGEHVDSLVVWEGKLVVGGGFSGLSGIAATNVASYDGVEWKQVGSNLSGFVQDLVVYDNTLVAVGWFDRLESGVVHGVAKLVGENWAPLVLHPLDAEEPVSANRQAIVYNNLLCVRDTTIDENSVQTFGLRVWDGSEWGELGGGIRGSVLSMHVFDGKLFLGGTFTSAGRGDGQISVKSLAAWDGERWESFDPPVTSVNDRPVYIHELGDTGNELYIAGNFQIGQTTGFARFDGTRWTGAGCGLNSATGVRVLHPWNGGLFVGGVFETANCSYNQGAVFYREGDWLSFNEAEAINDLVEFSSVIYGAGEFTDHQTWSDYAIGRRSGEKWEPVGESPFRRGILLGVFGGRLFAFGLSNSDTQDSYAIAAWDGVSWTHMGSPDGLVHAFVEFGGKYLAVGEFLHIGDVECAYVAAWNGASWEGIVGGPCDAVNTAVVHQGRLVVGGMFEQVGNTPANYIATFDGASWHPVGEGMGGEVSGLASDGLSLYICGKFTDVQGMSTGSIARWTDRGYEAMPGLLPLTTLRDVHIHDGIVYVCRDTPVLGWRAPPTVYAWNGSWSEMPKQLGQSDHIPHEVRKLLTIRNQLHIIGTLFHASRTSANYWARWSDRPVLQDVTGEFPLIRVEPRSYLYFSTNTASSGLVYTVRWFRNGEPVENGPEGASLGGGFVFGATTGAITISGVRLSDGGTYRVAYRNACGETVSEPIVLDVDCDADIDRDRVISPLDLYDYLQLWFVRDRRADTNNSGMADVSDIFMFLNTWLVGC